MSNFNSNTNKKDDGARNAINSRLQTFMMPNYNTSQGQETKKYKNDNLLGDGKQNPSCDRRDFKDDINQRLNSFNRMDDIGHKQLPFHNNIRDYTVTMDSKKDEFNDRLSNYNHLSSNMTPNANKSSDFNNMSFHKKFKDDTNKRLEELSPLSRNMGVPFNGTQMPKKPDFGSNIQNNSLEDKYSNYDYQKQFKNKEEDAKDKEIYLKNYQDINHQDLNNNVNYNSYDNFSYSSFHSDSHVPNRNDENLRKLEKNKESIQNFDYSIISNSTISNSKNKKDNINQLPDLAVYTSLPVDTRQEFHFNHQSK